MQNNQAHSSSVVCLHQLYDPRSSLEASISSNMLRNCRTANMFSPPAINRGVGVAAIAFAILASLANWICNMVVAATSPTLQSAMRGKCLIQQIRMHFSSCCKAVAEGRFLPALSSPLNTPGNQTRLWFSRVSVFDAGPTPKTRP